MYMLIEPKTNPAKNRIFYGILVALLLIGFGQYAIRYGNALSTFFTRHDLPLALAIGNVFVPILNKFNFEFKKKEPRPSIVETFKMEDY